MELNTGLIIFFNLTIQNFSNDVPFSKSVLDSTTDLMVCVDEGWRREEVVSSSVLTADGLAADWVYSHIYWTDTGTNSISITDFKVNH